MENLGVGYDIPIELQVEVLGYFIKDGDVLNRFIELLSEESFSNPVHRVIFSIVKEYYIRYLKVPSKKTVERELGMWIQNNQAVMPVPAEYFWREFDRLYEVSVENRDYLIDRVRDYVLRRQLFNLNQLIGNAVSGNDAVGLDAVAKEFNKLFSTHVGDTLSSRAELLLGDADRRMRENPSVSKVSTGFRTLDMVMGGGLGKGELGVVMAPTGVGKSFWLVTVGANCMSAQKRVLHVTLELSKEKVVQRYESFITKVPKSQLHLYPDRVQQRLSRVRRLLGGADVLIVEYPSRSLSVDELRALIIQLKTSRGFDPELLIVDYGDILKPVLTYRNEQGWEQLGFIFEKLRGLAQEFQIPVWTGSQSTPDSMRKEVITITDIAGSFQKVRIADVVLAICRTAQEVQMGRGRFFLDKNRDNRGKVMIPFREDFDTSRFWEDAGAVAVNVPDGESVTFSEGE